MNHITLKIPYARLGSVDTSQSGVALLTILLLVVAITVVAGSMVASQRLSIRQFELLQTQDQLRHDIKAGENLAMALIAADANVNNSDSLLDAWAQPLPPTQIGQHYLTLDIQDAAGRFNLNNLYHNGSMDEEAVAVFKRLLQQVGLEPELAYAVVDWQDPDSNTLEGGGAELDAYQNLKRRSATAIAASGSGLSGQSTVATISNQPFVVIEELMSVRGFTPEKFKRLQPYITAIPYYVPINLNTASPVLLSALAEDIELEAAETFYKSVQTTPLTTLDQALQQLPWSGIEQKKLDTLLPMLDVNSRAFRVMIDIGVEDRLNAGNQGARKHRYAMTHISKISADEGIARRREKGENDSVEGDTESATNKDDGAQATTPAALATPQLDNSPLIITAFGTRVLTYRPVF